MEFRIEHDYLGDVKVPKDAYWGAQTQRAIENFPISGIKPIKEYTDAIVLIKKAAAESNSEIGLLDGKIASAIVKAADEALSGKMADQFVVDVYQAGEGTSNNMNVNEVLANRAIEILGGKRGDYGVVHPNDHVNMCQSSNDVIPSAIKIASIWLSERLIKALVNLSKALDKKAKEFDDIIKSGRTHLMDAAPIRLGQEFAAWRDLIGDSVERIKISSDKLLEINIGATAVGTGVDADPRYVEKTIEKLAKFTRLKIRKSNDLPKVTGSSSDLMALSGALRVLAVDLIKISNDLRLMNSGPVTALGEIQLPAVQPGSSIMPGKVNPSIIEMVTMVAFSVIGDNDKITLATQAAQFELSMMEPVIAYNLPHDLIILRNAVEIMTEKAITGIKANRERMKELVEKTPGVGLLLNPYIGYEKSADIVKKAIRENKSVREVVEESGLLDKKTIEKIFDPYNLTTPRRLDMPDAKKGGKR
jgi:aspartate ammonia-lyase